MTTSTPILVAAPRRHPWRWVRIALLLTTLLLVAGLCAVCVGPPSYYLGKYDHGPTRATPLALPANIAPVAQTEPHTCGFCGLSAIYTAYGLSPAAQNLRFRVGVDMPLSHLAPKTRGTIHPDILRVLGQDGFSTQVLWADEAAKSDALAAHLEGGHYALALIRANELHWVVLSGVKEDRVIICDSLRPELYEEVLAEYLRDRVYSLVLIRPAGT